MLEGGFRLLADSDLGEGLEVGTDAIPAPVEGEEKADGSAHQIGGAGLVDDGLVVELGHVWLRVACCDVCIIGHREHSRKHYLHCYICALRTQ